MATAPAEKGTVVTVTSHDVPVADVVGCERMTAIAETLEILGTPAAVKAVKAHQARRTKFGRIDKLTE